MSDTWRRYYAAAGTEPRETLLDALAGFDEDGREPGLAVDLGCGAGRDTLELLRRGWRVVAVDSEPRALELLAAAVRDDPVRERLQPLLGRFEEAPWPAADLVNASFALPFVPPQAFGRVWSRIRERLRPGGRFAGHLFGERDGWAPAADMSFHGRADVEALLEGLEVERLDEVEEDSRTAVGSRKRWHLFAVVARRP